MRDDWAIVVPAGVWHNVVNTGDGELKLYSLYAPPEHPDGTVHRTKADAMAADTTEGDGDEPDGTPDHLAGAAADQLAERCRDRDPGSELGLVLKALVPEIEQDREVLERVVRALGGSPPRIKQATALGAERIGSLRMWLPMIGPGSEESARLEELELLISASRANDCCGPRSRSCPPRTRA